MARRRAGGGRRVARRRGTNYGLTTGAGRTARTLVHSIPGRPGVTRLLPGTNSYRGIRTLMKRSISDGKSMPEARTALLTSGNVKLDDGSRGGYGGATVISKDKTPGTRNNQITVRKAPLARRIQNRLNGT